MSSHYDWEAEVIARHDLEKPFAPENGETLKFRVGDPVVYTNAYGVAFQRRVTGFYRPESPCSLYARGYRYFLDSDCYWMPVRESNLQLDEGRQVGAAVMEGAAHVGE
jgi:hypothetical protein